VSCDGVSIILPPSFSTNVLFAQVLHKLSELRACLILQLVLGAQCLLEDRHQGGRQLLDSGVVPLIQLDEHAEDGLVLLVILAEREELDEARQDLGDRKPVSVLSDEAADTTSCVVKETGLILGVKKRLDLGEDGRQVLGNFVVVSGVLGQETHTVDGIGLGVNVLVRQAVEKDLEQTALVLCATLAHVADTLGNSANSGTALGGLLAAGVLHDRLLEHLPELGELAAESDSKAGDDLHGGLDDQPVILRGLVEVDFLTLVAKILLAGVTLGDDSKQLLAHVRDSSAGLHHQDRGTAELESGSDIAVDVSDSTPIDRQR
jgi:hypothetical protein